MCDTTLLVLAAGLRSRFGGVKQIAPVGPSGEAILEYTVYDALKAGFGKIVFLIRSAIEDEFRSSILGRIPEAVPIGIAFQERDSLVPAELLARTEGRTKPWGTAHALLCARNEVHTPFAVVNSDDYYGPGALGLVRDYLASASASMAGCGAEAGEPRWCLAGYRMRNTTSPNGAVFRGLCSVSDDDRLMGVEERSVLTPTEAGGPYPTRSLAGSETLCTGEELVSMNLWGFDLAVFDIVGPRFPEFVASHLNAPKAEFLLPEVVNAIVAEGAANVRALPTEESWFGVTYPEDLEPVRASIAERVARGFYPRRLWS